MHRNYKIAFLFICVHLYVCPLEPATPPVNVTATATSPRSISVMWENVLEIDQNGIITMYEVLSQPLETFDGAIMMQTMNVTERSADLTDLEEFVNYNISVRAYTNEGAGPYSEEMTVMIPEDSKFDLMVIH